MLACEMAPQVVEVEVPDGVSSGETLDRIPRNAAVRGMSEWLGSEMR